MPRAEQLTEPIAYHAEGAVWAESWGGLRWVDMLAGDVLSLDRASGAITRLHVDEEVAAMVRPRADGGFVVAGARTISLWDDDSGPAWSTPALWPKGARFNEGGCTPWGDVLCGTIHDSRAEGSAEMWSLGSDRVARRLWGGVTISNGLGFTADGTRMYYVDSRTRRIDVFDAAGGELTGRRPFVTVAEGAGNPDGLWVDVEDGVWVALYGGSAVHRYDVTGRLSEVVQLPVTKATSCTLGGDARDELFITTSRENLAPDEQPEAGSVFHLRVGVAGVPVLSSAL